MQQPGSEFDGAFDHFEPDDFKDPAIVRAKLAAIAIPAGSGRASRPGFDHDAFVDRCVRLAEADFYAASGSPPGLAVLACPDRDVALHSSDGEPLSEYIERLREHAATRGALAVFVVQAPPPTPGPATPTGVPQRTAPAVYFYSESRAGSVVHGFWRISGAGVAARLTEFHRVHAEHPNKLMHRIMAIDP